MPVDVTTLSPQKKSQPHTLFRSSASDQQESVMTQDPWSRPTIDDLRRVLESIGKPNSANHRANERLELSVPAEIRTSRGNTVSSMTREISRTGIGLLHRGAVTPGEVVVRMASETREFQYNVQIEWCSPCDNGMFMSGGRFLPNANEA